MAINFESLTDHVALPTSKMKIPNEVVGFSVYPMMDDGGNMERCDTDEEAEVFGLYMEVRDGHLTLPVWIGDYQSRTHAEIVKSQLKTVFHQSEAIKECARISAIMADNFAKEAYEIAPEGYISMLHMISEWAHEFYMLHKATDWEDFLGTEAAFDEDCWDEYVIAWTKHHKIDPQQPKFQKVSLTYRDGGNYKTYMDISVCIGQSKDALFPEPLNKGEEITMEDLGWDMYDFHEQFIGEYDDKYDHNILEVSVILPEDAEIYEENIFKKKNP